MDNYMHDTSEEDISDTEANNHIKGKTQYRLILIKKSRKFSRKKHHNIVFKEQVLL